LALGSLAGGAQIQTGSPTSRLSSDVSAQIQGKQQTWTGEITTAMCKSTRGSMGHDCILNCVKAGEHFVLVSKGHLFQISNQDFSNLKENAGHPVRLNGTLKPDGASITVTKIEMAGSSWHRFRS
jgi:hypothetical protein